MNKKEQGIAFTNNILTMLSMLYLTTILSSAILFHKPIMLFGSFVIVGSDLSFPMSFTFGDIIAEIFGYKFSRKLVIFSFICLLCFTILKFLAIKLPYPSYWHAQHSFELVLGMGFRYILGTSLAVIISELLNVYIISKWSLLVHGRFFWIRSICSTLIAQAINSMIFFPIVFFRVIAFHNLFYIVISAFIFKIIYAFVAAFPATIAVNFLRKKYKGIGMNKNFYPFKKREDIT